MKWHLFLALVAALHVFFMVSELFPWPFPLLLRLANKKLPSGESFTPEQRKTAQWRLFANLVHNAGIYNGIVAGGLLWAAYAGHSADDVARVMLAGAAVAGIFGTATLKSPLTALQAIVGIAGLFFV